MDISKDLLQKINNLPTTPGCYIFRNKAGDIIYIGKSKSLRNRVRQYFQKVEEKEGKYKNLEREAADVETILTPTERDALLVECRLIKAHKPRYNSQLVRERIHPFILINIKQDYPTISIAEQFTPDNACYGFFYNEETAADTIRLLNSIWQTPLCGKSAFPHGHRPCLNHHLKKCCAPCTGEISREDYGRKITEIRKCLAGKQSEVRRKIHQNMAQAAAQMDFEKAAGWRDALAGLGLLKKRSERLNTFLENSRVFLFFRAFGEKGFSVFYIEEGLTKIRMDVEAETETTAGSRTTDADVEELLAWLISRQNPANAALTTYPGEEKFMTTCLTDIFADKYYLSLTGRLNREKVRKKLLSGMAYFAQQHDRF